MQSRCSYMQFLVRIGPKTLNICSKCPKYLQHGAVNRLSNFVSRKKHHNNIFTFLKAQASRCTEIPAAENCVLGVLPIEKKVPIIAPKTHAILPHVYGVFS